MYHVHVRCTLQALWSFLFCSWCNHLILCFRFSFNNFMVSVSFLLHYCSQFFSLFFLYFSFVFNSVYLLVASLHIFFLNLLYIRERVRIWIGFIGFRVFHFIFLLSGYEYCVLHSALCNTFFLQTKMSDFQFIMFIVHSACCWLFFLPSSIILLFVVGLFPFEHINVDFGAKCQNSNICIQFRNSRRKKKEIYIY